MNNTFQILINWDKGQTFSERMAAKILAIEGFENIDPQSPMGGPDGKKDILCTKYGKKHVVGCYFPGSQKKFKEIKDKFEHDLESVDNHQADGFIFVTNQKITPEERINLSTGYNFEITIYHGERICGILDSPKGYGVRLEYLGVELSKEEQISFLNSHIDLKEHFEEIKRTLAELNKVTTKLAGQVYLRDKQNEPLSSLPISGVKFSSRLSIEDLLVLHSTIVKETQISEYHKFLGFRKVEVWIGNPGKDKKFADFVPAPPNEVTKLTYDLLKWWREEYMKISYGSEDEIISAIAKFHEMFLSIHPFLDGNGRIARTLAAIQYKDLLDKNVQFDKIERSKYYQALNSARNGSSKELNAIFTALIKE